MLAILFSGSWEEGQPRDSQGRPFLDVDPYIFGKILSYLRQKRIEGPESLAPMPVVDADKQAEFRAVANYYGLAEWATPIRRMQTLWRAGPMHRPDESHHIRGYKLAFRKPLHLHAVGVGLTPPACKEGVMVGVGQGQDVVLQMVTTSIVEDLPRKWASADQEVTCVAEGFDLTLQPPEAFIVVREPRYVDLKLVYSEDRFPHQAGPFVLTPTADWPPAANLQFMCVMCVEFSE